MGLALFTFQNHVFNPTFVVGAFVSFGAHFIKQERERCLIPELWNFIQMRGAFFSQSSFIFKWEFLPCSSVFASYFKKMEILFPTFLFGFFFPILSPFMGIRISCCRDSVFDVNVVPKCQASSHGSVAPGVALQMETAQYSYFLFLCYSILLTLKKALFFFC